MKVLILLKLKKRLIDNYFGADIATVSNQDCNFNNIYYLLLLLNKSSPRISNFYDSDLS